MSLKIVHGLVSNPCSARGGQSAEEKGAAASPNSQPPRPPTAEAAIVTIICASTPKVTAPRESISSYDKAEQLTKDIAQRIRKEGDPDAHGGLTADGGQRVNRRNYA